MVNESDAEPGALDLRGRLRSWSGLNPSPPGSDFPVEHPLHRRTETVFGNSGIEVASVAKMLDSQSTLDQTGRKVRYFGHGVRDAGRDRRAQFPGALDWRSEDWELRILAGGSDGL